MIKRLRYEIQPLIELQQESKDLEIISGGAKVSNKFFAYKMISPTEIGQFWETVVYCGAKQYNNSLVGRFYIKGILTQNENFHFMLDIGPGLKKVLENAGFPTEPGKGAKPNRFILLYNGKKKVVNEAGKEIELHNWGTIHIDEATGEQQKEETIESVEEKIKTDDDCPF